MKVISNRQIIEDNWLNLDDETAIDQLPGGKVIVSLPFWNEHKDVLTQRREPLGIKLAPEDDIADISDQLSRFELVALQFPAFRDGRGYSQARGLRMHYRYQGDIRATGNVLRDQVGYMERVGFSSFEIDDKQDINEALKAFDEINIRYQGSSDDPLPLYKRRTA